MKLHLTRTNFGKGINRCLYDSESGSNILVATVSHHPHWRAEKLGGPWNVCWLDGKVDWHPSLKVILTLIEIINGENAEQVAYAEVEDEAEDEPAVAGQLRAAAAAEPVNEDDEELATT